MVILRELPCLFLDSCENSSVNVSERNWLLAERATVERLLAEVDPNEQLTRWSLQTRLEKLTRELDDLQQAHPKEELFLRGRFLGILPTQRLFEFQALDNAEVISGSIDDSVRYPQAINKHLDQTTTAHFAVTHQLDGSTKYNLLSLPEWL